VATGIWISFSCRRLVSLSIFSGSYSSIGFCDDIALQHENHSMAGMDTRRGLLDYYELPAFFRVHAILPLYWVSGSCQRLSAVGLLRYASLGATDWGGYYLAIAIMSWLYVLAVPRV